MPVTTLSVEKDRINIKRAMSSTNRPRGFGISGNKGRKSCNVGVANIAPRRTQCTALSNKCAAPTSSVCDPYSRKPPRVGRVTEQITASSTCCKLTVEAETENGTISECGDRVTFVGVNGLETRIGPDGSTLYIDAQYLRRLYRQGLVSIPPVPTSDNVNDYLLWKAQLDDFLGGSYLEGDIEIINAAIAYFVAVLTEKLDGAADGSYWDLLQEDAQAIIGRGESSCLTELFGFIGDPEGYVVEGFTVIEVDENAVNFRLINNSNSSGNIDVVVFQQNLAGSFGEEPIAWEMLQVNGPGDFESFVFGSELSLSFNDSFGNYSPPQQAQRGDSFEVTTTMSGDEMNLAGASPSPSEFELVNSSLSTIFGNVYRSGKLLSKSPSFINGQTHTFEFNPTIWIGVVSGVTEGDALDSLTVSSINTQISLLGIRSADIVLTGGGAGPSATPYSFSLTNIVYA